MAEAGTPTALPAAVPDSTVADWYKTSPYSQTAPTAGLVNSPAAAPQVAAPDTTKTVATIDPNQFNPATPVNSTMTGATGTSTGYDATKVNVTAPSTVAGQVQGLIASNSPLMQQAQTQALQAQNGKGLLNSSMAIGAGQSAVIGAALPIAQQDATTNANAATTNAAADNTAKGFTAGATNTQTLANQQSANTAGQVNTTQANALQSQEIQQQGTVAQANQAAINNAQAQSAQLSVTAQTANQSAAVQQAAQVYSGALQTALANASAADAVQLKSIDAGVQTNLAQIQAQYNVQMQTSSSMSSTYQSYITQTGAIMADPNLDASGKQTAIANLTQQVNNAMQLQSSVSGLNLGSLVSPDTFGVTGLNGVNSGVPNVPSVPTVPSGAGTNGYGADVSQGGGGGGS